MPGIAAFYCVYDDDEWLSYSIASIYDAMDRIYFFVATAPWNGVITDNSKTISCIQCFPDPENKIRLLRGDWRDEVEQRNQALEIMIKDGFTYAFIVDADEIYDTSSLKNMLAYACSRPEVGCWHCWFIHYWKSAGYRINPPEKHNPPVLLRLGTGSFIEYRNCLSTLPHQLIPAEIGFCHHMSYARTDQQIHRKITSFSHSHQIKPDWFESVWKAWDLDRSIKDLCPYNPGAFHEAVPVPAEVLPPVLRNLVTSGKL